MTIFYTAEAPPAIPKSVKNRKEKLSFRFYSLFYGFFRARHSLPQLAQSPEQPLPLRFTQYISASSAHAATAAIMTISSGFMSEQ